MTDIMKSFEHEVFGKVRIVTKDDEPWFVARDIAIVLGYGRPSDAIRKHCRKVQSFQSPQNGVPSPNLIPESDVYRLIFRSHLPQAERFQDWVYDEVLPSIRKHGGYINASPDESPEELMARALVVAQQTVKRVEEQKAILFPCGDIT